MERLEYERTVYAGTREKVRAVIRFSSVRGRTATVELVEGEKVLDAFETEPLEGNGMVEAELGYIPSLVGAHSLQVRVRALDGETNGINNSEIFRVDVVKDRIGILFFDAAPDWNMTFLRRMCGASRRLSIDTAVPAPGGGLRTQGGERWEFPGSAGGLSRYDLVIVGGGGTFPSRRDASVLAEYVAGGGAVLMIASEKSPLLSRTALNLLEGSLPVSPVGSPRISQGEFRVVPARESRFPPPGGVEAWKERRLPPLPAAVDGLVPEAGAEVPLVLAGGGKEKPFLVVERKGEGISAVLLGFPVWRWRLAGREGEAAWEGLFGGLIQYLAEGRRTPPLDLQTDRTVYRMGERVKVTLYPSGPLSGMELRGKVASAGTGEVVETFLPEPDPYIPGGWRAVLGALEPGDYTVTVRAGGGEVAAEGRGSFTVEPVSVEMLRTSADRELLAGMASATGGRLLGAGDTGRLAGMIDLERTGSVSTSVRKVRSEAWFFAVMVLVFAAEWLLRKMLGLV